MYMSEGTCPHIASHTFYQFFFISFLGLISPGVSVPVQIPGGGHQEMGVHHMTSMTSQYWPRIQ